VASNRWKAVTVGSQYGSQNLVRLANVRVGENSIDVPRVQPADDFTDELTAPNLSTALSSGDASGR